MRLTATAPRRAPQAKLERTRKRRRRSVRVTSRKATMPRYTARLRTWPLGKPHGAVRTVPGGGPLAEVLERSRSGHEEGEQDGPPTARLPERRRADDDQGDQAGGLT